MYAWQDTIALILVLLAGASLARRGWRLFFQSRSPRGCGACGTCSGTATEGPPAITTIDLLPPKTSRSDR